MSKTGVVSFAFGVPAIIESNGRIAEIASKKARKLGAPVYTQADILVEPGIEVEYIEEEPGSPPPTLRIARGAVQWAKRRGLTELWIVAAEPHVWRCQRDLKYAISEARADIEVRVCDEIFTHPEEEWFCADSAQPRTRTKKAWERRENILQLMPVWLYKLVAS